MVRITVFNQYEIILLCFILFLKVLMERKFEKSNIYLLNIANTERLLETSFYASLPPPPPGKKNPTEIFTLVFTSISLFHIHLRKLSLAI